MPQVDEDREMLRACTDRIASQVIRLAHFTGNTDADKNKLLQQARVVLPVEVYTTLKASWSLSEIQYIDGAAFKYRGVRFEC